MHKILNSSDAGVFNFDKGVVRNYQGRLQIMGKGFLCFEKGRVTMFSAVTEERVIVSHAII